MTVYLDSSVLVKLYIDEPDSEAVAARVRLADLVATASLTYAEVCATFARRRREGQLTASEHRTLRRRFDADWTTFLIVDADDPLVRAAGSLTDSHSLRGADAIQLASFERLLAGADDDGIEFLCADDRLTGAARHLG